MLQFFNDIIYDVSNRKKHFLYAIPIGLIMTILCVIGVAAGMEYKDKLWGGVWSWRDFFSTILGGVIGQAIQIIILCLIL